MAVIEQVTCLAGNVEYDNNEVRFQWAAPLIANPTDSMGNQVTNPGSIMVYLPRGVKLEGVQTLFLKPRAIGGLFDLIEEQYLEVVLAALQMQREDIPVIKVVEQAQPEGDPMENRKAARKRRRDRRANNAAMAAALALPEGVEMTDPSQV